MDPIGIAGGANVYGFANGDPVNFSDPFGLCPDDDCQPTDAERAVQAFKDWAAAAFDRSITVLGAVGNWIRREGPGIAGQEAAFAAAGPVVGAVRNGRRVAAVSQAARRFLSEDRHLRSASIGARHDWAAAGLNADDVVGLIAASGRWETAAGTAAGRLTIGERVVQYSLTQNRSNAAEWVVNAWLVP